MAGSAWKQCAWMALAAAGFAPGLAAQQRVLPSIQSPSAPAPAGVQLTVMETALDMSQPAGLLLHLRLLNGSRQPVKIQPGMHALIAADADGAQTRCENPPDYAERTTAGPRTLRPGDSYSETVSLDADVCNGLRRARAVQVELMLSTADGSAVAVESQPIPLQSPSSLAEAIRAVLIQQSADWNRGDLDAFAAGYKNSPDILFIGRKISRGFDGMLASYRQGYATRAAMGTLTFAQLEVQPLDAQFATATGQYHLERTAAGGGNADGYFLLVLERTASGWKIVRDDTTSLPSAAKP